MNERIKELALEAGYNMDMQQHQRFAELIVRECLDIVEPDVGMACGDEWYTALEGAAQEIKEHFGVKE